MSNTTLIQCNLARCRDAQHLLEKQTRELNAGICAISEPRCIPDSSLWYGSDNGLAAIYWKQSDFARTCSLILKRRNFVVAEYGGIYIILCYISPNVDRTTFLEFVDDL